MGRTAIASTIGAAMLLGLVVAVIPDGQRRLSVDLWLVGVAAWAGISLARQALGVVPSERDRLRLAIRFRPKADEEEPALPRDLLALEGSLLAAADNARTYDHRLRPRLRKIVAHRLRVNRGIDLELDPERAAEALGEAAPLVDDTSIGDDGRAPSPDELTSLLDRSEPNDPWRDR